nr:MAG TPA: hypothetical protein [Caudoviricetes sp.]
MERPASRSRHSTSSNPNPWLEESEFPTTFTSLSRASCPELSEAHKNPARGRGSKETN